MVRRAYPASLFLEVAITVHVPRLIGVGLRQDLLVSHQREAEERCGSCVRETAQRGPHGLQDTVGHPTTRLWPFGVSLLGLEYRVQRYGRLRRTSES